MNQLDDQLRHEVARRGFAREEKSARLNRHRAIFDDLPVAMDHMQDIEKLPLVLVHALDLHIEHRLRIDRDSRELLRQLRERKLVAALHRAEAIEETAVVGEELE